jgi:hypothetical protein
MNAYMLSYLVAGIFIGWLLRWRRDKIIFDALKGELQKMRTIVKMIEHDYKNK